jgi:uncharacterized membrane protein YphA (DoxX/SURF4 family)
LTSRSQSGIYVEILIRQSLARVWELTQVPEIHQRWDLRFSRIEYLPRTHDAEPQKFLYETRIGFGLAIKGTGESLASSDPGSGRRTSSLKFASGDPKSLIRFGSGYWRYVPVDNGLRFFTWYDYEVRFGRLGWIVDRLVFRPLMGWATAWSFDRMRLWAETDQSPEASMQLSLIHSVVRFTLAFIWIWHGLIPKLIFSHLDERMMLAQAGIPLRALPLIGALEIAFGIGVLLTWNARWVLLLNALLMVAATLTVAMRSPVYLEAAFNPVTLNVAVIALCVAGWLASRSLPSASRCLRRDPRDPREKS